MTRKSALTLVLIWILWAVILIGFQILAAARFQPDYPDTVLEWTAGETSPGAHDSQPYLLEPFMNQQVAYDSEFYLSIAYAGYDDPGLRAVWLDPQKEPEPIWGKFPMPFGIPNDFESGRPPGVPENYQAYSLNYAFFPFYPQVIRALYYPLLIFGLNPIATATLAGVIVSLLGALGAMFALYDLTRDSLGDSGAIRTAFYLIAFPTGFFLAMVHTEGLFVGLAFGSLALLRRKRWILVALLAGFATVTRAVGGALIIPLLIAWLQEIWPILRRRLGRDEAVDQSEGGFRWRLAGNGLLALSPLIAFGVWNALLGTQFRNVEAAFFDRGMFVVKRSIEGWQDAFRSLFVLSLESFEIIRLVWLGMLVFTILLIAKIIVWQWYGDHIPKQVSIGVGLMLAGFGAALAIIWFRNTNNEQRTFYYMVEFSATILALAACAYTLRTMPGLALFSLMVVLISFFSGAPQGMHRYILGAPAVFVMLGTLGQDDVFDRTWTLGSVLLMGLFATLFAANFWVG